MLPSIFRRDVPDMFRDFPFMGMEDDFMRFLTPKMKPNAMKADLKETENGYEMAIDLPGFSKDEIELTLQDGVVTVKAAKSEENEKKDEKGVVVFRERHSGAMMRSFYVGENVKEEDIKAAFENGVLKLDFPKEEAPALPETKQIAIQ